jgi:hypothetical protein
MDICRALDTLIDRWCERRALRPLQLLLRAYPGPLAHTDQKFALLDALKDVKGFCRAELPEDELQMLIEAHNALEDSLGGKHQSA